MTKKTQNKMKELFSTKLSEVMNLVNVYDDLTEKPYSEIKLKIDLKEIKNLNELELFEIMVDTFSTTTLELYFQDMLTVSNDRTNRKIVSILAMLIGGRWAELKENL